MVLISAIPSNENVTEVRDENVFQPKWSVEKFRQGNILRPINRYKAATNLFIGTSELEKLQKKIGLAINLGKFLMSRIIYHC